MSEVLTLPAPLIVAPSAPSLWAMLKEDLACVFQRDPAARSTLEVATTYPGVHALIAHRLAHRLWQSGWRFSARLLSFLGRTLTNVDIHPGATIGRRFFIDHGAGVVIGETAEVGNDVTLYHGVTLGGVTWDKIKRHPTLADNVVIGSGAKILGPFTVGKGAKIGSNSVVVKEVPENATVVGIPGRMVMEQEKKDVGRADLQHGQLPDPEAKAISCLFDQIRELERKYALLAEEHNVLKKRLDGQAQ